MKIYNLINNCSKISTKLTISQIKSSYLLLTRNFKLVPQKIWKRVRKENFQKKEIMKQRGNFPAWKSNPYSDWIGIAFYKSPFGRLKEEHYHLLSLPLRDGCFVLSVQVR